MTSSECLHVIIMGDQDRVVRFCGYAKNRIRRTCRETTLIEEYNVMAARFQCVTGRHWHAFVKKEFHFPQKYILRGVFAVMVT